MSKMSKELKARLEANVAINRASDRSIVTGIYRRGEAPEQLAWIYLEYEVPPEEKCSEKSLSDYIAHEFPQLSANQCSEIAAKAISEYYMTE